MLHKVKGLVLSYIKFKETSVIVKIFTDRFGLQSYIINSVRSSKSKNKIALLQQLSLLEMVVYKNDSKDIQRVSEFKSLVPYQEIPFEHHKSGLGYALNFSFDHLFWFKTIIWKINFGQVCFFRLFCS